MKIFILKYLYIIATGSIFYLFSERYFWSFWRNGEDNLSGTLWGIVFYSVAAYAVLFLIDRYKVSTKEGLVVVGLLYGFIIEGMIAGMLYTPLLPMIILVALPWHALVTVLFGWHYLPKIISEAKINKKITVSLGLGMMWCLWAIGWFTLPDAIEYSYSISNFIIHGLLTTVCLVFVYLLTAWIRSFFEITFKTYEGYMILILLFTFLGLVHPGTITVSFPLSIAVITISVFFAWKAEIKSQ